jgi:hypothetical protein
MHVLCRTLLLPPSSACVPPSQGNYSLSVWEHVVSMTHGILGKEFNVPLVNMHRWTVPLHWAHIALEKGGWDCLHYSRPGLPEVRWLGWPMCAMASESHTAHCACTLHTPPARAA